MSDVQQLIDDYFTMWNSDDADVRLAAATKCFVDDATYTDPLADVVGPAGISAMVGSLRESHAGLHPSLGECDRRAPRPSALRVGDPRRGRRLVSPRRRLRGGGSRWPARVDQRLLRRRAGAFGSMTVMATDRGLVESMPYAVATGIELDGPIDGVVGRLVGARPLHHGGCARWRVDDAGDSTARCVRS